MDNTDLSLVAHLTEMRKRLLICVIAFFVIIPFAFYFSGLICAFIFSTLTNHNCKIYIFSITDSLVIRVSLSLIMTIAAELPLIAFELVRFIFPGLKQREKKIIVWLSGAFSLCFLIGAAAFVFLIAPVIVTAWVKYDSEFPAIISAKDFFDSWLIGACVSGLVCCVPVLIFGIIKIRRNMGY